MLTVYQGNPIRDSISAILTTPGSSPIGNLGNLFRPQIQDKLQQISSLDAFDFNLQVNAGENYAEKAQQYYVDRINRHDENTPWHEKAADWAGGTLSSLWTCENSDKTLAVLETALGAGRSTGANGLDDAARGLRNSSDDVQRAARNTNKVPQPKACFVAGTEIETPDGEKNIEDIKVGDLVIADDPTTPGEIESKRVEETFVRHTDEIVDLYVDGELISTTNEHPFWVVGEGWVEAGDLEVGDKLQTDEETLVDLDRIEKREGEFEVYNFKVEDFHTYFVSDLDVLVHNACWTQGKLNPVQNAFKHWQSHKNDFPHLKNALEYTREAKQFLNSPPPTALVKNLSTGEKAVYDPVSDVIGFTGRDGLTPATMYKPKPATPGAVLPPGTRPPRGSHGYASNLDYFNAQQ